MGGYVEKIEANRAPASDPIATTNAALGRANLDQMKTLSLLLTSRKFWIGTISVLGVACAVLLRVLDKIPVDALTPTILAIAATGVSVVTGVAWEDSAKHAAGKHHASSKPAATKETPAAKNDEKTPAPPPSNAAPAPEEVTLPTGEAPEKKEEG